MSYQSYGFSLIGVVTAMRSKCYELGPAYARRWTGNATVDRYNDHAVRGVADMNVMEMVGDAEVIGTTINLTSLLDVRAAWLSEGRKIEQRATGDGVELTEGFTILPNGVVELKTKTGDFVYLMTGTSNRRELDLHEEIAARVWNARNDDPSDQRYDRLRFPAVSIKAEHKLKQLTGARCGSYNVEVAKQDIEFRLDEKGAEARAATLIRMTRSVPKMFTIDESFMVALLRPGCIEPYFVAKFTY